MLLLLLLAGCLLAACWLLTLAAPQGKDDGCGNFSCFPRLMNETAAISRPVRVRQSSPFPSSRHAAKDARNRMPTPNDPPSQPASKKLSLRASKKKRSP